jgi:hypothetical protein
MTSYAFFVNWGTCRGVVAMEKASQ